MSDETFDSRVVCYSYTIIPTFLEAFGLSPRDNDLELLIERHGLGKLAAAIIYAVPYAKGEISERVAAQELDLQYAFAIAVVQALRDVIEKCAIKTHTTEISRTPGVSRRKQRSNTADMTESVNFYDDSVA